MHAKRRRTHRTHRTSKRSIRGYEADILSIAAGVGVISTGVLAFNAGKTIAMQDFSDYSQKERILEILRILVPTMAVSTATIGCIGASRVIGRKRERSLLEACTLLSAYISGNDRLEEKDTRGGKGSGVHRSPAKSNTDIEDTGTGDIIFIETFTGRRIKASMELYEHAIKTLQDRFSICGVVTLNELYELMTVEETAAGEVLAWTSDQMVLDPDYIPGEDYFSYDEALTKLAIQLHKVGPKLYEIHYNILPIGSLAGIGPCNY